jgi:hypothetical protein
MTESNSVNIGGTGSSQTSDTWRKWRIDVLTCRSTRLGGGLIHVLYNELTNCQSVQWLRSFIILR